MANTHSARIDLELVGREVFDAPGQGSIELPLRLKLLLQNGTSNGQVDTVYADRKTGIGASVTTVYDLTNLTGQDGATVSFAEVTTIAIRNRSATAANYLTVGPDATAGFGVVASNSGFWADATDRNVVNADYNSDDGDSGWLILHCRSGVSVSGGSTDELAVITQGGTSSNTWDLLIFGRSA